MKKLISLMLALILVCSMIPMTASAAFDPSGYFMFTKDESGNNWTGYKNTSSGVQHSTIPVSEFNPGNYDNIVYTNNKWFGYSSTGTGGNIDSEMKAYIQAVQAAAAIPVHTDPRDHDLGWNCNTKYHWKECACGARFGEELHVDPLETENDYCVCGYHFSSNADLVTLWVKGCPGIKNFNKNTTEYKLNAYTYKDVKEVKFSTRTHDSESTVELPEDLTLKEGENKFEIKVHSENKKVTKVYTVIINKEPQK